MKTALRLLLLIACAFGAFAPAKAAIQTIDFDDPNLLLCAMGTCMDNQPIGNFYDGGAGPNLGVSFNDNLGRSTANNDWKGFRLIPYFPPQSLNARCGAPAVPCGGVAYDSGPTPWIQINFTAGAQPVDYIRFFYTTNDNLSLDVFDTTGVLRVHSPDFFMGCNFLSSVCNAKPNTPLVIAEPFQIGRVDVYSNDPPNSLTIDTLQFGTVPEPASLLLLGCGVLMTMRKLRCHL